MSKNSKGTSQTLHFRKRYSERVGISISKKEKTELINKIQGNKLEFLHRTSGRVSNWKYTVDGKDFVVCYDGKRHKLVTIMPMDYIRENGGTDDMLKESGKGE